MAYSKLYEKEFEALPANRAAIVNELSSRLDKFLAAIKKLVKKYRDATEDQVYMSSNFKLDN